MKYKVFIFIMLRFGDGPHKGVTNMSSVDVNIQSLESGYSTVMSTNYTETDQ